MYAKHPCGPLSVLIVAALAISHTAIQAAEGVQGDRPNIVLILSDDYGLDGVGCYGSDTFKTPNIDALAESGLRFDNAYCTPLCGPTRCLLNTGRYGFRTGGLTNQSAGRPLPTEEPSIARLLKQAGYATGHCGKWRQMGALPGTGASTNTSPIRRPAVITGRRVTPRTARRCRPTRRYITPMSATSSHSTSSSATATSRSSSTTPRTSFTARSCARRIRSRRHDRPETLCTPTT